MDYTKTSFFIADAFFGNGAMNKRLWWVWYLVFLILSQLSVTGVYAAPDARTQVTAGVTDGGAGGVSQNSGYVNTGNSLSVNFNYQIPGTPYYDGSGQASVNADISRNVSNYVYSAGSITGSGQAQMLSGSPLNVHPHATAQSSGIVDFFYTPILLPGVTLPSEWQALASNNSLTIPITFAAQGEVSISSSSPLMGYGYGNVYATTNAPNFNASDFRAEAAVSSGTNLTAAGSFAGTAHLQGLYNTTYYVGLFGQAGVNTWGNRVLCGPGPTDTCAVASLMSYGYSVSGLTFIFDQAAFDLAYGPTAIPLNDYFTLDFSPNMPVQQSVPVPATILLLASGLIGLAGMRRFKK